MFSSDGTCFQASRAIIAPSYADIFYNNCFKNGILPIELSEDIVNTLLKKAASAPGYSLTVDLESQKIYDSAGFSTDFTVDPFRRHCLLNGLDDIGLTLVHSDDIAKYEAARPHWREPLAV